MAFDDHCVDLKNTIIDLTKELRESVFTMPEESGDLMMAELYFRGLHPDKIMQHAIKFVLPYSNEIKERDRTFFFNENTDENEIDNGIFSGLEEIVSQDKINYYRQILSNAIRFDDEDEEVVWDYFDTILALIEEYRKKK